MMAFRISWRVRYDKNHLLLHYHEAPAADTSIASGLLGIERRGRLSFLTHPERLARPQLVSLSLWEVFSYLTWHLNLEPKTAFSCVIVFSFWVALSSFGVFSIEVNAESVWRVLVWDKCSCFTCMWILVVYTGLCSHSNENGALLCDLRESSAALIKKYCFILTRF